MTNSLCSTGGTKSSANLMALVSSAWIDVLLPQLRVRLIIVLEASITCTCRLVELFMTRIRSTRAKQPLIRMVDYIATIRKLQKALHSIYNRSITLYSFYVVRTVILMSTADRAKTP